MLLTDFLESVYLPSRVELSREYTGLLRATVRRLGEFLGHPAALDDLTEESVAGYLAWYRGDWTAVSTNNQRTTVLTLWRSAYEFDLTDRAPRPRLIRALPEEVDPPEAWSLEECQRLFAACRNWPGSVCDIPAGAYWSSLALSVYWTACRIGALRFTPISAYAGGHGLLVRKQKNKRPQWYPLPPSCCEAVDACLGTMPRPLIWPWAGDPKKLWREFRRIVEAAALPAPHTGRQLFHRLRRTCLSLCAAQDPAIAQRQAGHASYETTLRHYIDPRMAGGLTAADVLPDPIYFEHPLRIFQG